VGKSHLAEALGYQAVKMGLILLCRSIFDLVKQLVWDEAFEAEEPSPSPCLPPRGTAPYRTVTEHSQALGGNGS